jgi:PAS domain S-box-containing protein
MKFEYFTAFIITGGFEFLVALILIFFTAIVRQNKLTISLFMICKLLNGLALIGLGLQGSSTCNLTANISLAALFCSWLFLILSVSSFRGKLQIPFTLAMFLPVFISVIAIQLFDVSGKPVAIITTFMVIALFIPAAIQLLKHHKPFRLPVLMAVCYILFALVNVFRAIVVYLSPETYNFFEFSGFDHWYILISLGIIVISSLGFFLLIIESDKSSLFELSRLNKVAFEQSPLSIVTTDLDGAITYANPAFSRISGYSKEEVLHKTANVLQSGQTPKETFEDLWKTVTSGKVWYGEFINKKKNGDIYYEDVAIAPLQNEKGIINGYFSIKTDTSERRKNEQLIIQQNSELKEMDVTKNKLFSIIAHDLRGPMGSIMNLLLIAQKK